MYKKVLVVIVLIIFATGCSKNHTTGDISTASPPSAANVSPATSPTASIIPSSPDTLTQSENASFFPADATSNVYAMMDYNVYDNGYKRCNLQISLLGDTGVGKLYNLKLDDSSLNDNQSYDRTDLGCFYVTDEKIYQISQAGVPSSDGQNFIEAVKSGANVAIPPDAIIACQDTPLPDALSPDATMVYHHEISVSGDICKSIYYFNNPSGTPYYENIYWQKGKGIIYFESGWGAGRDGIQLIAQNVYGTLNNYENNLPTAINSGDFGQVSEYLTPGGNLYNAQKDLVARLYNKGTRERLTSFYIESFDMNADGTYAISVDETIGVKRPEDSDFTDNEYHWIYTMGESGGKLGLSDIKQNPAYVQTTTTKITTSEVFNNCGNFTVHGGKIYYIDGYDNGALYSMNTDGSDKRKLKDGYISSFTISGEQIFYSNSHLYTMNLDGSGQQKLKDGGLGFSDVIVGDKIYYSDFYDSFALYSINTDGSGKEKLSDVMTLYENVVGDRIYYAGGNKRNRGIYYMKTDGTGKTKLADANPYTMFVADGWIYYDEQDDGYSLYAVKIDGSGRHKLTDDYALSINIAGGRIYYVSGGNERKIYSIKTDGSDKQLISDDDAYFLVVSGGKIYYSITGIKIYSMNTDGSDKQILVNFSGTYKNVTYEVDASLHTGMPKYHFVATGLMQGTTNDSRIGFVMGLNVYDEKGSPLLSKDFSQTDGDRMVGNPVPNGGMDTMGLHVTDVNFDGYKDVIIFSDGGTGAHGNTWYNCWLWNPKTSEFLESISFEEICNPVLDPAKKCIYSTGGSGAFNHGWDISKFIDGEFVVTNNLYLETKDDKSYHFTEEKLVNGKMKTVRDDVIQADNWDDAVSVAGYINDNLWQLDNPRWYGVADYKND